MIALSFSQYPELTLTSQKSWGRDYNAVLDIWTVTLTEPALRERQFQINTTSLATVENRKKAAEEAEVHALMSLKKVKSAVQQE